MATPFKIIYMKHNDYYSSRPVMRAKGIFAAVVIGLFLYAFVLGMWVLIEVIIK